MAPYDRTPGRPQRWGDPGASFDLEGLFAACPDTPVVGINDSREHRRDQLLMFSDDDRVTLRWRLEVDKAAREALVKGRLRTRWYDTIAGRFALFATGLAAMVSVAHELAQWWAR